MPDYLFLMHDDAPEPGNTERNDDWDRYVRGLRASGNFQGGSAIGGGICARKSGRVPIIGFIRVSASRLEDARPLLVGNPVFEAGGTVEIRELPRTE